MFAIVFTLLLDILQHGTYFPLAYVLIFDDLIHDSVSTYLIFLSTQMRWKLNNHICETRKKGWRTMGSSQDKYIQM